MSEPRELGRCSLVVGDERWIWDVPRLWRLSAGLPASVVPIETLAELDLTLWGPVTLRDAVGHFRRASTADLRFPIILAAEGWLMDGSHRVVSALATGRSLLGVRFPVTPEPDRIVSASLADWWLSTSHTRAA